MVYNNNTHDPLTHTNRMRISADDEAREKKKRRLGLLETALRQEAREVTVLSEQITKVQQDIYELSCQVFFAAQTVPNTNLANVEAKVAILIDKVKTYLSELPYRETLVWPSGCRSVKEWDRYLFSMKKLHKYSFQFKNLMSELDGIQSDIIGKSVVNARLRHWQAIVIAIIDKLQLLQTSKSMEKQLGFSFSDDFPAFSKATVYYPSQISCPDGTVKTHFFPDPLLRAFFLTTHRLAHSTDSNSIRPDLQRFVSGIYQDNPVLLVQIDNGHPVAPKHQVQSFQIHAHEFLLKPLTTCEGESPIYLDVVFPTIKFYFTEKTAEPLSIETRCTISSQFSALEEAVHDYFVSGTDQEIQERRERLKTILEKIHAFDGLIHLESNPFCLSLVGICRVVMSQVDDQIQSVGFEPIHVQVESSYKPLQLFVRLILRLQNPESHFDLYKSIFYQSNVKFMPYQEEVVTFSCFHPALVEMPRISGNLREWKKKTAQDLPIENFRVNLFAQMTYCHLMMKDEAASVAFIRSHPQALNHPTTRSLIQKSLRQEGNTLDAAKKLGQMLGRFKAALGANAEILKWLNSIPEVSKPEYEKIRTDFFLDAFLTHEHSASEPKEDLVSKPSEQMPFSDISLKPPISPHFLLLETQPLPLTGTDLFDPALLSPSSPAPSLFHLLDQISATIDLVKPISSEAAAPALPAGLALSTFNINPLPARLPPLYSQGPKLDMRSLLNPVTQIPEEITSLSPQARVVWERVDQWKAQIKNNCTTFIQISLDRVKYTEHLYYPKNPGVYILTLMKLESDIKEVPALLAACEDVPDNVKDQLKATMETWSILATKMIEPFDPIVLSEQVLSLIHKLPIQSNFLSFQIFYGNKVKGYVPDKAMQAYFHLLLQDYNTRDHDEIKQLFQKFYLYENGNASRRNNIVLEAKGTRVEDCYYVSSVQSFFQNILFRRLTSFHSENKLFQFSSPPYKLCQDPSREQQLAAASVEMHINILSALRGLRESALFALASKNDQELKERLPHARTFADNLTAIIPLEQLLPEYQALVRIGTFAPPLTSALNSQVGFKPMHTLLCIRTQEPHPQISIQIYLKLLASACSLHLTSAQIKKFNDCSDLDKFAEKLMKLYNEIHQRGSDLGESLELSEEERDS